MAQTSPFLLDDVKEAHKRYNAIPVIAAKGGVTLAVFRKLYADRHPKAVAAAKPATRTSRRAPKPAAATPALPAVDLSAFTPEVQQAMFAQFLSQMGMELPAAQPVSTNGNVQYDVRLTNDEVAHERPNAARNALLWALNAEGLLGEALDRASENGEDYITQENGQALMAETFGPLPERVTTR